MDRISFEFSRPILALAFSAATTFSGVTAGAQDASERPVVFGIGLGAVAANGYGLGSAGLGTLGVRTPWRNTTVRLDGAFASWPGRAGSRLTNLTANAVYSHRHGLFAPYLIGGVGGYAEPGRNLSLGINGGVGLELRSPLLHPFVELREHDWRADQGSHRLTLLTIGINF